MCGVSVPNVPSQQPDVSLPRPRFAGCLLKLSLVLAGAVLGTVLTVAITVALLLPVRSTVQVQSPPTAVATAGDYQGYALAVKRVGTMMSSGNSFEVWLGRHDGGEVSRGHVLQVPTGWRTDNGLTVRWSPETVRLDFAGGGRIEVPVRVFRDAR
ncbi:hypothetical protein GCM10010452_71280 [Crossiella cryophila]